MMRWGENETYRFVKIYLSHNYLWNCDHQNYKLKDKRQKAYQEIIDEFMVCTGIRLNESEVKIKIKNLRSTYTQEIAKIRTRSSTNSYYTPTIKWFSDWHKCFKHNSRISLIELVNDVQPHTEESIDKPWTSDNIEQEQDSQSIEPFPSQEYYELELKCEANVTPLNSTNHSSYKSMRKKSKTRSPSEQSDRIFRGCDSSLEPTSREDEFEIYGRHIASQLRKMNLHKALRLQLQIQRLVSEARIADISVLHR